MTTRDPTRLSATLPYRELETRRLVLRRPRADDAVLIFRSYASDPEVTRYLAWTPHASLADAEDALAARLERLESGVEYSWILERRDDRALVGLISAWFDADGAEVGFVVARPCWGQGIATEALEGVAAWTFGAPECARLWATCDVENQASARVLEKAGFVRQKGVERLVVRPNLGPAARPSLYCVRVREGSPRRVVEQTG